ncbi:hypothetical protein [Pedobacter sp. Leaf194]|uniref:DUF6922 domain-containing protein n=1 Tax=Pedobacter sp. Leaf194 TaxID=1736297 RepID=UPI0007032A0D|nr:hypothetical protein [Pedobacter sp. Leaf194]KQS41002.1 hypothetical protein ASG14_00490 [Pedobacter sp. Leaf194]
MKGTRQARVILVQWKRFTGLEFDVFSSLKNFCDSYPDYSYHTISNYLSKKKEPFENDQIRIERKPILTKLSRPELPKSLFWDMKHSNINWQRSYRIVIERVITRGEEIDWEELLRFYGQEKIVDTLKNEIGYLPELIIDKVCKYFRLTKNQLKCYTKTQLQEKHWI